jgi:hypothetical protein
MKEERLKKIAKVAAKYYLSDSPEWEDEALVISDYVSLYDIRDVASFTRWFRGYVNEIAGYE